MTIEWSEILCVIGRTLGKSVPRVALVNPDPWAFLFTVLTFDLIKVSAL